jgi:hypothetical protein
MEWHIFILKICYDYITTKPLSIRIAPTIGSVMFIIGVTNVEFNFNLLQEFQFYINSYV